MLDAHRRTRVDQDDETYIVAPAISVPQTPIGNAGRWVAALVQTAGTGRSENAEVMADSAAPDPSAREKPAFDTSMSARSSFKKKFVSAHAVLPFDQPMLIYHGGSIVVWLLLAFVLPFIRWIADDDRGFHSAFVWAMSCLFVALFYVCEYLNHQSRLCTTSTVEHE